MGAYTSMAAELSCKYCKTLNKSLWLLLVQVALTPVLYPRLGL